MLPGVYSCPFGTPRVRQCQILLVADISSPILPRTSRGSNLGERLRRTYAEKLGLFSAGKGTKDCRYDGSKLGSSAPCMRTGPSSISGFANGSQQPRMAKNPRKLVMARLLLWLQSQQRTISANRKTS